MLVSKHSPFYRLIQIVLFVSEQISCINLLNDILKPEINDSVHEICAHYNVPCIDLKGISKGAGHPDAEGMKAMAEQTVAAVKATEAKAEEPVAEAAE